MKQKFEKKFQRNFFQFYLLFFSKAVVDEGVSGVLGNDLTDLLGDFTGDPAVDLLSASFVLEGDFFVGESPTPFVVGSCENY